MPGSSNISKSSTPDICTFGILSDGKEIPSSYHILSISISREINRIPSAVIIIKDGDASKSDFEASSSPTFIPGRKIEISFGYRSNNKLVFRGLIINHRIRIRQNTSQLLIECRDDAVKMTRAINSRYYHKSKDSDIMSQLITGYGLIKDVEITKPALKEVVQHESTDWDFLVSRAEANGKVVFVENGRIKISEPFTKSSPVLSVSFGSNLLEFDAEIDSRIQTRGIKASCWDDSDQKVLESAATEPSLKDPGNLASSTLANVLGTGNIILNHGGKLSESELKAWADGRLLKERLAKIRGRIRITGNADVMPGNVIELKGVGDRFNGNCFVSGVRHEIADGNWITDVQIGMNPELFTETYDISPPPAAGLLPPITGLYTAIVTALENDPDGEDRIRIRLPLISTSDDGIWARLSTLDAGDGRGTFYRPEISDEVIVGFLHEDPRFPVILGMCHSKAHSSPEPAKDTNHRKGYVSREKIKFIFDDEKKSLQIETPGRNKIIVSDDEKGIRIEDQNNNMFTLDNNGVVIESKSDINMKASGKIKIEGSDISLSAQTSFTAEGAASAEISGASTTIKGSGSTTIKGGTVMIN